MNLKLFTCLAVLNILVCMEIRVFAQDIITVKTNINGLVINEKEDSVPFATIYIKELQTGTAANISGVFSIPVPEGSYTLLVRKLGYQPITMQVKAEKGDISKKIILKNRDYSIREVKVYSKGEDPAYNIMRNVIGLAPYHLNQVEHYRSEVYLKGSFVVKKLPKVLSKKIAVNGASDFKIGMTYMEESLNEITFDAPDQYTQRVISFNSSLPGVSDINPMEYIKASLYQPMIDIVISPLAPNAFQHYRFKYEGSSRDGEKLISKIRVIPKRKSQQLLTGTLFIVEDIWTLYSVNLELKTMFGIVQIRQVFEPVKTGAWLPVNHNMVIHGSVMGIKMDLFYAGSVKYTDVKNNDKIKPPAAYRIPAISSVEGKIQTSEKKNKSRNTQKIETLFQKEEMTNRDMIRLSKLMQKESENTLKAKKKNLEIKEPTRIKLEKDARNKDSLYWEEIRPIPLTSEEISGYRFTDSIKLAEADLKSGQDSVKKSSGKTTKVLKKITSGGTIFGDSTLRISYGGLIRFENFDFNTVDGWTFSQSFSIAKTFDSGRLMTIHSSAGFAINRQAFFWNISGRYRYAPLVRGQMFLTMGSRSTDFNRDNGLNRNLNALASLFFRENHLKLYEDNYVSLKNKIDLFNGFQTNIEVNYSNRFTLENSSDFSFFYRDMKNYTSNNPVNPYLPLYPEVINRNLVFSVGFNYTPQYYFRMNGHVKRMEYSKFPTFHLEYKKGLPDIFSSQSDFDYLEAGIHQSLNTGLLSKFRWSIQSGTFMSKRNLDFVDFKHFNTQKLPVLFNSPEDLYAVLNYYFYSTPKSFFEAHLHFSTPYLFLKYLPFFSKQLWEENLYLNYLNTPVLKNYTEAGYSISQLFFFMDAGVFVGFENGKYREINIKFSLNLN